MPNYAKFLKEILGNKRKLEDYETVKLNTECFVIILNKLPSKLKMSRPDSKVDTWQPSRVLEWVPVF